MANELKVGMQALAWDEGEEPVEFPQGEDENAIQSWIVEQLETKEFGKIVRSYPGNAHVTGGELVVWYRAFTDEHRGRQIVSGIDEAELDEAYRTRKAFCEQKVFTPAELYALRPVRTDYGDYHTISVHLRDEIEYYAMPAGTMDALEASPRMETRTLVDHDYDGRRTWTLQTVWFDGQPVMVTTSSGRDGDEYHDRWVTDAGAFGKMVEWLRSFSPADEKPGFVEASSVIPDMTEFYNHTIHDYYDVERQEPRKKQEF